MLAVIYIYIFKKTLAHVGICQYKNIPECRKRKFNSLLIY